MATAIATDRLSCRRKMLMFYHAPADAATEQSVKAGATTTTWQAFKGYGSFQALAMFIINGGGGGRPAACRRGIGLPARPVAHQHCCAALAAAITGRCAPIGPRPAACEGQRLPAVLFEPPRAARFGLKYEMWSGARHEEPPAVQGGTGLAFNPSVVIEPITPPETRASTRGVSSLPSVPLEP
jgi:hypothetical protein